MVWLLVVPTFFVHVLDSQLLLKCHQCRRIRFRLQLVFHLSFQNWQAFRRECSLYLSFRVVALTVSSLKWFLSLLQLHRPPRFRLFFLHFQEHWFYEPFFSDFFPFDC